VIAASDPHTAEAGAAILREGGNAFDAALSAMLAAPMSEPVLTSMGGGGFMLAYHPGQKPVLYDFFVDVPPKRIDRPDFYPIEVDFGTTVQEFHIGTGSIAVPGMIAGIDRIHRDLGSMPMGAISTMARQYAREGITLSARAHRHCPPLAQSRLRRLSRHLRPGGGRSLLPGGDRRNDRPSLP
jgi:gamma-glutamyltranspeptidase/glutathione hydrolase